MLKSYLSDQLKNHKDWPEESQDIFTSNTNARVTFIQDSSHNYMSMSSAHALSDFAVNYVNPLYAYSSDITEDENPVIINQIVLCTFVLVRNAFFVYIF